MSRRTSGLCVRPLAIAGLALACSESAPERWQTPASDHVGSNVSPGTFEPGGGNVPDGPTGGSPSDSLSPMAPQSGGMGGTNTGDADDRPGADLDGTPSEPAAGQGAAPVLTYNPPEPAAAELLARTWKLSHSQYQAAVQALLGAEVDTDLFVADASNGVFENFSSVGLVRVDLADNYLDAASDIAAAVSSDALEELTSCDLSPTCAEQFIAELGARAFRRPLRAEEVSTYRDLFDLGASDGETERGFRAVVQGLLNSPHFLYRTEIGAASDEANDTFALTSYEVAELLAFSLLNAPPPDWLLAAAADDELVEPVSLRRHVDQLLEEPGVLTQLNRFLSQWLEIVHFDHVTKFEERFPGFEDVREDMAEETAEFLAQYGTTQNTFAELLLSPVPTVSRALDQFYLTGAAPPAEPQRIGVLGLGTVLSHHAKPHLTSPTLRGTFIRSRFFCQSITLPPGFTPPPLSETEVLGLARTTRELYQQHQTDPSCSTCHRLTDNIGFSLEEFDGAGRFRTIDDTQGFQDPVDSSSELTDSDVNRPINSHVDLSQALSESELVRQCMAIQAFRFYFGQGESERGLPPLLSGHEALRNGGNWADLITGLMTTESTWRRKRQ